MSNYYRVTVENLATGDVLTREVADGDYVFVAFGGCHLGGMVRHANGTVQLTVKGHAPTAPPRPSTRAAS